MHMCLHPGCHKTCTSAVCCQSQVRNWSWFQSSVCHPEKCPGRRGRLSRHSSPACSPDWRNSHEAVVYENTSVLNLFSHLLSRCVTPARLLLHWQNETRGCAFVLQNQSIFYGIKRCMEISRRWFTWFVFSTHQMRDKTCELSPYHLR